METVAAAAGSSPPAAAMAAAAVAAAWAGAGTPAAGAGAGAGTRAAAAAAAGSARRVATAAAAVIGGRSGTTRASARWRMTSAPTGTRGRNKTHEHRCSRRGSHLCWAAMPHPCCAWRCWVNRKLRALSECGTNSQCSYTERQKRYPKCIMLQAL